MSAPAQSPLPDTPGVTLSPDGLIALRQVTLKARGEPALANLPGGFATRRKGHGQEVADVRQYVAGDDIRHLDRGTTARTGEMHVRQFQEERDRITILVADFRPSMLWGITRAFRSVAAAEALALIGWQAVEDGGRTGLLAITSGPPVIVPPRGRARGMLDVIGGMVRAHRNALQAAMAGETTDPPLAGPLSRADRIAPRGAELVIASGFDTPGDGFGEVLSRLDRDRVPRLMAITDADGTRLPRGDYPVRLSDGRHVRIALDGTGTDAPDLIDVEGFRALRVDAGQSVEDMARRLAAAFPPDRAP